MVSLSGSRKIRQLTIKIQEMEVNSSSNNLKKNVANMADDVWNAYRSAGMQRSGGSPVG